MVAEATGLTGSTVWQVPRLQVRRVGLQGLPVDWLLVGLTYRSVLSYRYRSYRFTYHWDLQVLQVGGGWIPLVSRLLPSVYLQSEVLFWSVNVFNQKDWGPYVYSQRETGLSEFRCALF